MLLECLFMSENVNSEVKTASTKKSSAYNYSAEDDSILDHLILSRILPPLLEKVIPWGLPANIITIFSNTCVFITFLIAMLSTKGIYTLWFAIPVLIIVYLLGDALDGCQARRTHTGSPLGEYMDHFLDCFVNAELMIPIAVCYKLSNSWIIFGLLFIAYMTQAAAFWERYSLGHMHFAKFSSTETLISLDIILTLGYFTSLMDFLQNKVSSFQWGAFCSTGALSFIGNLSLAELFICVFLVFASISTILNFVRTKGASLKFWLYFLMALGITILSAIENVQYHYLPLYISCLYSVDYIASLIVRIVEKKKDPIPDFLLPLFMLIVFIFKLTSSYVLIGELIYVCVRIVLRAVKFIYSHKQYWYWKNPPMQN